MVFTSHDIFEILDGVRRSKAAEVAGQPSIKAEVFGWNGKIIDIPLEALRSPDKNVIDTAGSGLHRWLETLGKTMRGSQPPPILVQPGTRGIPVADIVVH